MSDIRNTSVCDNRDPKFVGELGDGVHSRGLWPTHGHDFLSDADAAGAHANSDTIGTCGNEMRSLTTGNNVAGDNLKLGECLFDPFNHFDLVGRVSLTRVYHNDVEALLDEQLQTIPVGRSGPNRGSGVKLFSFGVFGSERIVDIFQEI